MALGARVRLVVLLTGVAAIAAVATDTHMQSAATPTNDLPNPYVSIPDRFILPAGRTWGSTSAVEIDRDGRSIWVAERCQANGCFNRDTGQMSMLPTVLQFDATGTLRRSFGQGLLVFPHGIFVDRDGNVWVTDGQDDAPAPFPAAAPAGSAPAAPLAPRSGATRGHQVFKFSPTGALLMTLGTRAGGTGAAYFYQPDDVLVTPRGDIFVSEGHGGGNNRILKFDRNGRLLKEWGRPGTSAGEFDQPHALAMDSRGRLFVGDRNNNRIQIFDQDGTFLEQWPQFSRPSGLYIDANDTLYCADSESEGVSRNHDGWKRGIRIGSARDGAVRYLIPDPETRTRAADGFTSTSAAEGVAVDRAGNIYGAEVGPRRLMTYVKR
jgi:DNA-binding beta-propeller fold protein YncE